MPGSYLQFGVYGSNRKEELQSSPNMSNPSLKPPKDNSNLLSYFFWGDQTYITTDDETTKKLGNRDYIVTADRSDEIFKKYSNEIFEGTLFKYEDGKIIYYGEPKSFKEEWGKLHDKVLDEFWDMHYRGNPDDSLILEALYEALDRKTVGPNEATPHQQGSVYYGPTISHGNVFNEGKTKNKEGLLKRFVKGVKRAINWIGEHKKQVAAVGVTAALIGGALYTGTQGFGGDHSVLPGEKVLNIQLYKDGWIDAAGDPSIRQTHALDTDQGSNVITVYMNFIHTSDHYIICSKEPKIFTTDELAHPEKYMYKVIGKDTKIGATDDAEKIKNEGGNALLARSIDMICLKSGDSLAVAEKGNKSLTFSFVPDNYVDQNLPPKEVKIEATDAAPVSLEREKNNKTVRQLAEASA